MKKIYMISLGGKAPGANIEVHDVQFAVGDSIDTVLPVVRDHWYGLDFKLHMDSYMEVKGADGHSITLKEAPSEGDPRLFFAFLGGYEAVHTQEIHDVRLLVCNSEREAKGLAIKSEGFDRIQTHVDSVIDVEQKLLSDDGETYYLELTPTEGTYKLIPEWFGYRRLDQQ